MIAEAPETTSVFLRLAHDMKMTPDVARLFLQLNLTRAEVARIEELLEKSRRGEISPDEARQLNELRVAGDFLTLVHLHARETLGLPLQARGG